MRVIFATWCARKSHKSSVKLMSLTTHFFYRTAELEGNVNQFNSSELCMSYRYHLQQLMAKRNDRPFLVHDVDVNNDFEGNLRLVPYVAFILVVTGPKFFNDRWPLLSLSMFVFKTFFHVFFHSPCLYYEFLQIVAFMKPFFVSFSKL